MSLFNALKRCMVLKVLKAAITSNKMAVMPVNMRARIVWVDFNISMHLPRVDRRLYPSSA